MPTGILHPSILSSKIPFALLSNGLGISPDLNIISFSQHFGKVFKVITVMKKEALKKKKLPFFMWDILKSEKYFSCLLRNCMMHQ